MPRPLRILALEDDRLDAELLRSILKEGGVACEMRRVQTRANFVAALEDGYDLVLSDFALPYFDGLSALEIVRGSRPDLPFILVSGALGEEIAIESLKRGATDYVLKHRLERLVPAVRRAMREAEERRERKKAEEALAKRARQQSAVANLGRRALANTGLAAVLDETVALVARTLGVEYCSFLEILPGGEGLLLRSGVGWKAGTMGSVVTSDSQAVYTLSCGQPVIAENLNAETRFGVEPTLREHGVASCASVVVHGQEEPFGVLAAHAKRERAFDGEDVDFLRAVANVLSAAMERKRAEEVLDEAKESERRRIAANLHDEVLQDLIDALSEVQLMQVMGREVAGPTSGQAGLEGTVESLRRSVEGLRAAIFDLRIKENLERSFASLVESLVELNRRMSRKRREVHLTLEDSFPEAVPAQVGTNLVRIIQEALNNARRHSGARNIWVKLGIVGGEVRVEVTDDGLGFDAGDAYGGIGIGAMRQRARDLGVELEIESRPGAGTRVRFRGRADRLLGVDLHPRWDRVSLP